MQTKQNSIEQYQMWVSQETLPIDLKHELEDIAGDESAIALRFGSGLDFGTGGLRGVMGAGLNRLNVYTIRSATRALAEHLLAKRPGDTTLSVAIGYDCRHHSQQFAIAAGCTLAAAGIKAYVSPVLCPTPELSWAVRELKAAAGIMITASHNPPEYNGYKVYNEQGGQILEADALDIRNRMLAITDVFAIPHLPEQEATDKGQVETIHASVRASYLETVVENIVDGRLTEADRENVKVVYTPLHGTGLVPVRDVFHMVGYRNADIVESQSHPDGNFTTVKSPNPEEPEALELAVAQAKATEADVAMGTDPDADRVGIAVRTGDGLYQLLTGNQVGALLVDYFVGRLPVAGDSSALSPIVFKTIVTSDFGAAIARQAGVAVEDTLTGFKYIGDRITHYEQAGTHQLLAGYEESYGYLLSPIVRDKDAVQTCLAIAEMVAYHKTRGETLVDRLEQLYQIHGYYAEKLLSIQLEGEDGVAKMQRVLASLREQPLQVVGGQSDLHGPGLELVAVEDYLSGLRSFTNPGQPAEQLTLPTSDVQKFIFDGGHWAAVRPSGTEPKMKVYLAANAKTKMECDTVLAEMSAALNARVQA